jgi:AGZA family xanthine/uracil permease-like MFS transporter
MPRFKQQSLFSPGLFSLGDTNAFFALLLDNVVNLVVLSGILVFQFGFPADFVLTRMVPGTALGVMIGDLLYTWMAVRKGDGRTAMPLGLDTPSTIGVALIVIGPVYLQSHDPYVAWEVGMATLFLIGLTKVLLSFAGDTVVRILPMAALLGPLAGVGLALLGLFPIVHIFDYPVAGLVGTGLVLYALVAGRPLPGRIPGALAAVAVAAALYWGMNLLGIHQAHPQNAAANFGLHVPLPEFGHLLAGLPRALDFLPVALPFGLLTVIGGINATASARAAGDEYRPRDILLVEAGSTLVAAVFGGVAQSTPYIGHPAYKAMGAKAGYTLATGLVVGIGGMLGLLGVLVNVLPEVAVAPILLFVGIEITVQAVRVPEPRHLPAVAFSILPVLAYLVSIYTGQLLGTGAKPDPALAAQVSTMSIVGQGFILTAMLWGAAVAFLLDGRPGAVAATFGVLAVFSLFGVIHSVDPDGGLQLPSARPVEIAAAYALTGALLAGLMTREYRRSGPGSLDT